MSISRIYTSKEIEEVTKHYPDYFTFNASEWINNPENYAIQEGPNIGFAEYKGPGVYWVHFCFHTARGRQAINLTQRLLERLHTDKKVTTCVGLISEDNKKARWLIRQVGFKSLGLTDTKNGLCEMFYLTKENS